MPGPIFTMLSLDELAQQAASRSEPHSSDRAYLVSVGVVAAVIIGLFLGIGFSLLAQTTEQIIGRSGPRDRGTEVKPRDSIVFPHLASDARSVPTEAELPAWTIAAPLSGVPLAQGPAAREYRTPENSNPVRDSVSPASEAAVSTATGAVSNAEAPAVGSTAREATLAAPATVSPHEPASSFQVATTPATPPASPRMSAAEIAELLARGDSFMRIGDIASARVFYERAADARDGRAALRMGATFDPAFLSRAGLRRTFGDPAQARSWYRRALDLGAVKAERQ
jgi:hypothetical protein